MIRLLVKELLYGQRVCATGQGKDQVVVEATGDDICGLNAGKELDDVAERIVRGVEPGVESAGVGGIAGVDRYILAVAPAESEDVAAVPNAGSGIAVEEIVAGAAVEHIDVAGVTSDGYLTGRLPPVQLVVARATQQQVAACSAGNRIVAAAPIHLVITPQGVDYVMTRAAIDQVVAFRAQNGTAAATTRCTQRIDGSAVPDRAVGKRQAFNGVGKCSAGAAVELIGNGQRIVGAVDRDHQAVTVTAERHVLRPYIRQKLDRVVIGGYFASRPTFQNHIPAVSAAEAVGIVAAAVVGTAAEQQIIPRAAVEHVVAGTAVEHVVACAALHGVVAGTAVEGIIACAAVENVAGTGVQTVVASPAFQYVVALIAIERVVAVATVKAVITGAAENRVGPHIAIEAVVAFTPIQRIVAGTAVKRVVAAQAIDNIVAAQAIDDVIGVESDQVVIAWRCRQQLSFYGRIVPTGAIRQADRFNTRRIERAVVGEVVLYCQLIRRSDDPEDQVIRLPAEFDVGNNNAVLELDDIVLVRIVVPARHRIPAVTPAEQVGVVTRPAVQRVGARATIQSVVAGTAKDSIGNAGAGERVAVFGAGDIEAARQQIGVGQRAAVSELDMVERLAAHHVGRIEVVEMDGVVGVAADLERQRTERQFEVGRDDARREAQHVAGAAGGDMVGAVALAVEDDVVAALQIEGVVAAAARRRGMAAGGADAVAGAAAEFDAWFVVDVDGAQHRSRIAPDELGVVQGLATDRKVSDGPAQAVVDEDLLVGTVVDYQVVADGTKAELARRDPVQAQSVVAFSVLDVVGAKALPRAIAGG